MRRFEGRFEFCFMKGIHEWLPRYVFKIIILWDFLGCRVDKNPLANAGDTGLILGPGRFHMPWRTTSLSLYKGYNSGTAKGKSWAQTRDGDRGQGTSMPSPGAQPPPLSSVMCSPTPKLLRFLWRFYDTGMTDEIVGHWQLMQVPWPLLSLEVGSGAESSKPLNPALVFLDTSPHTEDI